MANNLRRILIVADSADDRDYTKRLLTRDTSFDWQFSEAAAGEQGLALALTGAPFDCILLDYRLGDMDGIQFLDRLRTQAGETSSAAVVVLTAPGDESAAAVSALKRGAQDYLSKHDLNSQPLLRAVEYSVTRAQLTQANRESAKALAESEERYRNLAEALSRTIIWTATPEGVFDFVNAHQVEFQGITPEEFNGWMGRSLVDAEKGHRFSDAWATGIGSGQPFAVEHRLPQHSEAGWRWYLSRATPIRDGAGCVVRWIGSSTDMEEQKRAANSLPNPEKRADPTVRHQAKEALRRVEILGNAILFSPHLASIVTDDKGIIQFLNAGAEGMLGYSAGEIVDRLTLADLAEPGEGAARAAELSHELGKPVAPDSEALLYKAARDGEDFYNLTCIRKNGSKLAAVLSVTPLRAPDSRIIGYVLLATDDTAHRQAEAALQRLDQQLQDQQFYTRSLIESSSDALLAVDPAGLITGVNRQTEALTGCTRDELINAPFQRFFTDAGRAQSCLSQVLTEGKMNDYELTARGCNGLETVVWCNAASFHDRDRKLQGVFVCARDVTDRKLLEQAVAEKNAALERAKAASEKANTAKVAFLSGMSREIRTPMNTILGMSDLLAASELDTKQTQLIESLQQASGNLLALINDLLDLSKLEAGHLELEQRDFNLEELVDHLMELPGVKSRAKGVVLLSHLLPDVVTRVSGDATRLSQVLSNLLDNAVRSTTAGVVLLTVKNRESNQAAGTETGLEIEFVISDTGAGIAPDKLETIFEGFTKADWSMARQDGATALGLELSRSLVERMGGTLTVASQLGEGSTFRFNIPFSRANPSQRPTLAEETDFHGLRVLVINDDSTNRLILCDALNGWGMQTTEFSEPSDALANLIAASEARRPYSLVIVDRSSSGTDGFETAVMVHQVAPELPVIMLTSDVRAGDVLRRRTAGLSGYAVKPVKRTELLRLLSEALRPRHVEERPPQSADSTETGAAEALKILIAEDSEDNRLLLQLYLNGSPHRLTFVCDGKAAVERFAAERFDLVLMDLHLPLMDGLTATRAIRAIEDERGTVPAVVIALTANARLQDVEASVRAGCNHYLWKPISRRMLLTAIKDYGRLGAAISAEPESTPAHWLEIRMPAGLESIVPRYLASRRNEIPEMMALLAASGFDRIADLAHNMKGTGTSYGLPELTRMGAALERSAKQKDAAALSTQLAELQDYASRVILLGKPG